MRKSVTAVAGAVFLLSATHAALVAQSEFEDPRIAAVSWVLEDGGLASLNLGDSLVVDTAMGPQPESLLMTPAPLAGRGVRSRRIEIAAALGARPGTLTDHLRCPRGPPRADDLARNVYHGCRLIAGAVAVLVIGEPRSSERGTIVDVVTRTFTHSSTYDDYYYVLSIYREVLLERTPAGTWKVQGVLRKAIGHG